jgi:hypothetical protein
LILISWIYFFYLPDLLSFMRYTTATVGGLSAGASTLQLTDTGGTTANLVATLNSNVSFYANTSVFVHNTPVVTNQASISVGTSATTIDSFSMSTYRSARYRVQVSHASAGYEVSEVLVVHNGTTASQTQFGVVYTGAASLGNVSVTTSAGNVLVQFTGVNTANTVKVATFYTTI